MHQNRKPAFGGLMSEEVEQAAPGMFGHLCVEIAIVREIREAEEPTGCPEGVPVP